MEENVFYKEDEIPKDYEGIMYVLNELLMKHNRLVERYNRLEDEHEDLKVYGNNYHFPKEIRLF